MRRAFLILLASVFFAPTLLFAQIHGTRASVTSLGPLGEIPAGPPPSVTSVGPFGFNRRIVLEQNRQFSFRQPALRRHHGGVPVIVPYYYPVYGTSYDNYQPDDSATFDQSQGQPDEQVGMPATIRVIRVPVPMEQDSGAAANVPPTSSALPAATTEQKPVAPQPSTILIFRDGRRMEVQNYAIQGPTLYNLSDHGPKKITIADLDVNATVKANDERGIDFSLPGVVRGN